MAAVALELKNTPLYVNTRWLSLVVVVVCFGVQAAAFTDPADGESFTILMIKAIFAAREKGLRGCLVFSFSSIHVRGKVTQIVLHLSEVDLFDSEQLFEDMTLQEPKVGFNLSIIRRLLVHLQYVLKHRHFSYKTHFLPRLRIFVKPFYKICLPTFNHRLA